MTTPRQARGKRRTVPMWGITDASGVLIGTFDTQAFVYMRKGAALDAKKTFAPTFGLTRCTISYSLPRRKGAK